MKRGWSANSSPAIPLEHCRVKQQRQACNTAARSRKASASAGAADRATTMGGMAVDAKAGR